MSSSELDSLLEASSKSANSTGPAKNGATKEQIS
jgi:hypothetical protein